MTPDPLVVILWGFDMFPPDAVNLAARLRAAGVTTQAEALAAVRAAVEGLEKQLGIGGLAAAVLAAIDKVEKVIPFWQDDHLQLWGGDCREVLRELPAESVHCVVTSPPYWGLRDYGIGEKGLGLEATPEAFVANMVAVFREVRRVLRKDGTLWMELGDSYVTGGSDRPGGQTPKWKTLRTQDNRIRPVSGLKSKDLVGIPWRVAFALQADGWYLRSDIIWAKPNPMPESVTDRPTKAHEYLFLLTRSPRYYYDAEAVREPHAEPWRGQGEAEKNNWSVDGERGSHDTVRQYNPAGRNLRSVWNIATEPYPGAHFATFPRKLVEPCVKAGTSERGVCPECGAPWVRVTDGRTKPEPLGAWLRERREARGLRQGEVAALFPSRTGGLTGCVSNWELDQNVPTADQWARLKDVLGFGDEKDDLLSAWHDFERGAWGTTPNAMTHGAPSAGPAHLARNPQTTGWRPSCPHEGEPVPAVVLDPFAGSGTTLFVAQALGRRGVGIDLSPDYLRQALERNRQTPLGLVG